MKSDLINVKADGTFLTEIKSIERSVNQDSNEESERHKNRSDSKTISQSQMNELASKFESLQLNLNALSKKLDQQQL